MASMWRIYITWQGIHVKLPEDDTEMLKHVGVYITYKDTVVNEHLLVVIKTIFTSILWDRLEPFANTIADEYKAFFRQAWSTMDQIFTEKQILEKCWEINTDVIQIYIVFQQACDSVDGAVTWYIMREFRIPKTCWE